MTRTRSSSDHFLSLTVKSYTFFNYEYHVDTSMTTIKDKRYHSLNS